MVSISLSVPKNWSIAILELSGNLFFSIFFIIISDNKFVSVLIHGVCALIVKLKHKNDNNNIFFNIINILLNAQWVIILLL